MKSLFYSNNTEVDTAYIITIKGHKKSEEYSLRCQQSCEKVGMKYVVWEAFDGTVPGEIRTPEHLQLESFIKALKVSNHYITRTEVAATLSHLSLWLECAKLDKPIVILEHDAIMLRKYSKFDSYNAVVWLGSDEWVNQGWKMYNIPPHGSDGPNNKFILRAHAYAIDPPMAKNLLAYNLWNGICGAPDYFMRADLFHITHQGLYAYDLSLEPSRNTSITNRDLLIPAQRNDDLRI
jgi:hypothetical protein